MKRMVMIFVTLMIACCGTADTAVVDGIEWTYEIKDRTATIVNPDTGKGYFSPASFKATGNVTIPSELAGFPVTSIGDRAFYCCNELTNMTMPSSVTNIGKYAFQGCEGLTSVVIPERVTCIGEGAFYSCDKLKRGTLPSGLEEIDAWVFAGCGSLETLAIPDTVKRIGDDAFYHCSALQDVKIPSSLIYLGNHAFCGCDGLTSVVIPASVIEIPGSPFDGCSNLKEIKVASGNKNFAVKNSLLHDKEILTVIQCPGALKTVIIPSSVMAVRRHTFGGNGLTSFSVASGNRAFSEKNGFLCNKSGDVVVRGPGGLRTIEIPQGIREIAEWAFVGCKKIEQVMISSSVISIGSYAFEECEGLTSVTIPSSVKSIGHSAFSICSGLTSVTICAGVTNIGDLAFSFCSGLTSVTIPSSVTSIGSGVFLFCNDLETIYVEKGDAARVKKMMGDANYDMSGIRYVEVESGSDGPIDPVYRTVTFDANGGTCATDSVKVSDRAAVGELPTATRSNYDFLGWFTAAVGGEQVSSETVVTADVTWYAQWHEYSTAIIGAKCSIDIGLKGYATKTLPKGLTYNSKTGLVTGTCKAAEGEYKVTFTKKGAVDIVLTFVVRAEKTPTIVCEGLAGGTMTVGVAGGAVGGGTPTLPIAIDAESGVKSVTATKLPTGMKIASSKDKTSWYITGAPTKAGTYEVAITLTTAAGNKVTEKFTVTVAALPSGATGTFNGFVLVDAFVSNASDKDGSTSSDAIETIASTGNTLSYGTLQVTVSDVGKITAKVVAAAGTYSFTATGWDSFNEGVYSVKMATKKGDVLTLTCDSTVAWNDRQLTGSFVASGATALSVEAQKNAFGKQWFFKATGDEVSGWTLSFAENAKAAALTVTLNADGKTAIAGTLYGASVSDGKKITTPSYKVSASGYADVSGIAAGAIFADFAPVISVKNGKTTTKKVLSLRVNLWFDKKDNHEEGVGSAVFVP